MQMICSFIIPILINNSFKETLDATLCFELLYRHSDVNYGRHLSYFLCDVNRDRCWWFIPLAMILPLDATTTPKEASEWTAMIQFGGYIISGIIPMLVGVIKDMTNTFDVALFTLLFIIIIIMGMTLKVKTKTESATIRVLSSR